MLTVEKQHGNATLNVRGSRRFSFGVPSHSYVHRCAPTALRFFFHAIRQFSSFFPPTIASRSFSPSLSPPALHREFVSSPLFLFLRLLRSPTVTYNALQLNVYQWSARVYRVAFISFYPSFPPLSFILSLPPSDSAEYMLFNFQKKRSFLIAMHFCVLVAILTPTLTYFSHFFYSLRFQLFLLPTLKNFIDSEYIYLHYKIHPFYKVYMYTYICRLRIFMNFYIFMNITKEIEPKQKFISSTKYYNKYSTFNILYIYAYHISHRWIKICNLYIYIYISHDICPLLRKLIYRKFLMISSLEFHHFSPM